MHGLYWLVVNLAASRPLLIAVDDAHWADEPSLRWLAYLAPRLEGLAAGILVALRQGDAAVLSAPLLAVRAAATAVMRPALLSEQAVSAMVRAAADGEVSDELRAAVYAACGGNPLYLAELLRAADLSGRPLAALEPAELLAGGLEGIARLVITRVRGLGADALGVAQALAVLGDGCELRHAAAIAGVATAVAARLAGGLVRAEVLAAGDRPRFVHPVIRDAREASLDSGGIALEVANAYAALFRWVDAVDVIERALAELGETDQELAGRLEGELVVCGLHDARRAPRVAPVLARLRSRRLEAVSEPLAVAQAMAMLLAGRPARSRACWKGRCSALAPMLRTGIPVRRCCGCWSWLSVSARSRSRSSRCWSRFTAAVRRVAL